MPIGKVFTPPCTLLMKVNTMKHEDEIRLLDEVEVACVRAEKARKDVDLLVALRVLYKLLEERVKEDERRDENGKS